MIQLKRKKQQGIDPVVKLIILLAIFGIPILFLGMSWGLFQVFEIAPWLIMLVFAVFYTSYVSMTAKLLYDFYESDRPIATFIPFIGDLWIIDSKYRVPGLVLYFVSILFGILTFLPYSVLSILGQDFALSASFYFMLISILCLAVVQGIKGIGLISCLNDIGKDWCRIMQTSLGVIGVFKVIAFIPFVRIIAIYAINKPLSAFSFQELTVNSGNDDVAFVADDEEYDEDEYDDSDDDEDD